MRILHITGYMGDAGIGKAISGVLRNETEHDHVLMCLERSEKRNETDRCIQHGIQVLEAPDPQVAEREIRSADIVIVHWWNYPPMCAFLMKLSQIPCRALLWSHISGVTYPFLPAAFLRCFDAVFFTSPVSYENPEWSVSDAEEIRKISRIVYGLADIQARNERKTDYHSAGLRIVYVGTFTKSKLHARFASICAGILERCPEAEFIMVGDDTRAAWLKDELDQMGISRFFHWTGFVTDVYTRLRDSDLFLYPLNPYHFGTTENVLLEALAIGLPIVALRQAAEKYIVDDGVTGLLAEDIRDIPSIVEKLYRDEALRERMGNKAQEEMLQKYSISDNIRRFRQGSAAIIGSAKRTHSFGAAIGETPDEWFLSFLSNKLRISLAGGHPNGADLPDILFEDTKSSIFHFLKYYPGSKQLEEFAKIKKGRPAIPAAPGLGRA